MKSEARLVRSVGRGTLQRAKAKRTKTSHTPVTDATCRYKISKASKTPKHQQDCKESVSIRLPVE
eukprot:2938394-Amphidinium_carterae.1